MLTSGCSYGARECSGCFKRLPHFLPVPGDGWGGRHVRCLSCPLRQGSMCVGDVSWTCEAEEHPEKAVFCTHHMCTRMPGNRHTITPTLHRYICTRMWEHPCTCHTHATLHTHVYVYTHAHKACHQHVCAHTLAHPSVAAEQGTGTVP